MPKKIGTIQDDGGEDVSIDDLAAGVEPTPVGGAGEIVADPLAPLHHQHHHHDPEQAALDAGEEAAAAAMEAAAAAEAADAALGNVLDGVDVGHDPEDGEMALAAAAAAAAVQAADGMAVVVDQALLATAAAAAASQVAEVLGGPEQLPEHHPNEVVTQGGVGLPPPLPEAPIHHHASASQSEAPAQVEDGDLLEARREKDRKRYSAMTPEARAAYNAHRRELYHKQGEAARKRRRERERERYHSLEGDTKKKRNERRAKLERERYQKLSKEALAARNERRRSRAKQHKSQNKQATVAVIHQPPPADEMPTIPPPGLEVKTEGEVGEAVPTLPEVGCLPDGVDAAALAAEVAEQVIAGANLDGAMEEAMAAAVPASTEGDTVQI